ILLLFLRIPDPLVDAYEMPDETEAERHFYRYWCAFQVSWVFLYLVLFCPAISPKELSLGLFTLPTDRHSPVWEIVTNLVNNVNTFFVVVCFFALYDPPSMSSREGPINKWGRTCGMAVVFMLTA